MSVFTEEIKAKADDIVARYKTRRASMLEILRLMMEQYGHITLEIESAVAAYLDVPAIDVREVVTFYTLYYTKMKAKTRLCVCRTLSCSLRGSDEIIQHLQEKLGIKPGQTTPDGKFSLETVECLGACETAPMMQLNDDEFIGELTKDKVDALIKEHQNTGVQEHRNTRTPKNKKP
jgi:NADH-quinone oxidoreductase E subunit